MSYTPIAQGTLNWDVPVNAAFVDQDTRITNNGASIASNTSAISTLNARQPIFVRKTADEIVNNSNTYQDDDQLIIAVTAGQAYRLEGFLSYNTTTAAGINLMLNGPAGSSAFVFSALNVSGGTNDFGTMRENVSSINVGTSRLGGAGATDLACMIQGLYIPTTSGNFMLRWAQNVATAVNTTVRAHSWLELRPVT